MSTEPTYAVSSPQPARRGIRGGLFFLTIAFIAGIGVMGWALTQWDVARIWLLGEAPVAETARPVPRADVPQPVFAPPPVAADQQLVARLAAIEARMALLEANGAGVNGSSSRADALIAAFMARRAIDRGAGLGAAEALLSQQFGVKHARDVAAIIDASRKPVTLAMLTRDLDALIVEPAASGVGWWDSFTQGFSELITVRSAETVPTDPPARLARARSMLVTGEVERARIEVSQLPFDERARAWVLNAQRYRDVQSALDRVEAAALAPDPSVPAPALQIPQAVQGSPVTTG